MWATEEYAIITFISIWVKQIKPMNDDPVIAMEKIYLKVELNLNKTESRIKPYPPSFNKIEARIIDPTTGASTWAFGSHKWPINTGNFTKNAITLLRIKIQWISWEFNFK